MLRKAPRARPLRGSFAALIRATRRLRRGCITVGLARLDGFRFDRPDLEAVVTFVERRFGRLVIFDRPQERFGFSRDEIAALLAECVAD